MPTELTVELGAHSYGIHIGLPLRGGLFGKLNEIIPPCKTLVVTDSNLQGLYEGALLSGLKEAGFMPRLHVIPAGEASKSLAELSALYDDLEDFGLRRGELLIACGGGVVGDLGGFAAATYLRGIPFVQIPTTLLAQVDSSVGGKVGINLPPAKNRVGAFHQPQAVLIDPAFLTTLPERVFQDGMAEVIKYAAIADEGLFSLLESLSGCPTTELPIERIIADCCRIKGDIVAQDERDQGCRMLLNFGHTIGHALEAMSGFSLSHGEAVAIGMFAACRLGELSGLTQSGTALRLANLLKAWRLPHSLPAIDEDELTRLILQDKKTCGGKISAILLARVGSAFIQETEAEFFTRELCYE